MEYLENVYFTFFCYLLKILQPFVYQGTPVYIAGSSGPLFLALHGAGDTACSFACLAKEIK